MKENTQHNTDQEKISHIESVLDAAGTTHRAAMNTENLPEMPLSLQQKVEDRFGPQTQASPPPLPALEDSEPTNIIPFSKRISRPGFAIAAIAAAVALIAGLSILKPPAAPGPEQFRGITTPAKTKEFILFNASSDVQEQYAEAGLDIDSFKQINGTPKDLEDYLKSSESDECYVIDLPSKEIRSYRQGQVPPVTITPLAEDASEVMNQLRKAK